MPTCGRRNTGSTGIIVGSVHQRLSITKAVASVAARSSLSFDRSLTKRWRSLATKANTWSLLPSIERQHKVVGTFHVPFRRLNQLHIDTWLTAQRSAPATLDPGVSGWPRLFHSMRASRQTELQREFPLHVVCSWLGNSPRIAQQSYLLVTEDDFAKAAGVAKVMV